MLKVTGGELRGRRFQAPKGRTTRPTSEKVRQAIFDTLGGMEQLPGATVLDLFAGSGALGIEALSRGAAHVTFVESHARTAALVRENLRQLGIPSEKWWVAASRAEEWLRGAPTTLPPTLPPTLQRLLILADPPYAAGDAEQVLATLAAAPRVPRDSVIVLEAAARLPLGAPPGLELIQVKRYGDTQVLYLRKVAQAPPKPEGG